MHKEKIYHVSHILLVRIWVLALEKAGDVGIFG
jgi:hypothetical protein